MLESARKHPDARARKVLEQDGERARNEWGCPFSKAPQTPDKRHADAIESVNALIGGQLPLACPLSHARHPDAKRVWEWYDWKKDGQLELVIRRPSLVVKQAIDACAQGCKAREAHETEEALQRARAANPNGLNGG